jgi:hypothetical protein
MKLFLSLAIICTALVLGLPGTASAVCVPVEACGDYWAMMDDEELMGILGINPKTGEYDGEVDVWELPGWIEPSPCSGIVVCGDSGDGEVETGDWTVVVLGMRALTDASPEEPTQTYECCAEAYDDGGQTVYESCTPGYWDENTGEWIPGCDG